MPKSGPRTTYRFSNEFKATAVRLSELPGVAVQDVASSLYIHPFMLSRWRKDAREGRIVTKDVKLDREVVAELADPPDSHQICICKFAACLVGRSTPLLGDTGMVRRFLRK
jgi:transposase-like protein